MIPDTVENARYDMKAVDSPAGLEVPVLLVNIDGVEYTFEAEQKLINYGGVSFSGWTPERNALAEQYEVVLEIEGRLNKFEGATNDPRILELVHKFIYDLYNNQFKPGKFLPIK